MENAGTFHSNRDVSAAGQSFPSSSKGPAQATQWIGWLHKRCKKVKKTENSVLSGGVSSESGSSVDGLFVELSRAWSAKRCRRREFPSRVQ
jgi:hypothetical protein